MASQLSDVSADQVKARHHKWLAAPKVGPRYWGLGTLAFLDAQQGTGKSLLTVDLAAAITRGQSWPDREPSTMKPANVFFSNIEDDEDADIVPRLVGAGADLKRVKFPRDIKDESGEPLDQLYFPRDLEAFKTYITRQRIKLAVIDPADSHMRLRHGVSSVLVQLRRIAKETECTIILIRHIPEYLLNKPAGSRGAGGYQVASNSRMGYDLLKDATKTDRVFLRHGKNNWLRPQPNRAFSRADVTVQIEGEDFQTTHLVWEAREIDFAEIVASLESEMKRDAKTTITYWLDRKLLAAGDQGVEWQKLKADAEAAGFTAKAIGRAANNLGVVRRNTGRPRENGRGVTRIALWYHPEYATVA